MWANHHLHPSLAGRNEGQGKFPSDHIPVSKARMALPRTGQMGMEPSFHALINFLH